MNYVEKFLRKNQLPIDLRISVRRYLEYNWELKKIYKIEEEELLSLLNVNLRDKITVFLNSKILKNIEVFNQFPISFLSNVSFIMKKKTINMDENLFLEKEIGTDLYFILNGKIALIH